ncbi:MAG: glycosyltransferase family 4 protein [Bryobacteraceae bacterium]
MRILSITAGAAGMYCGSCLRDNALAAELMRRGHDVILLPLYTPLRTDEVNVAHGKVFFGGISIYLQQQSRLFRKTPRFVDRLWDSRWALKLASRGSIPTSPKMLGELTVSTLSGANGIHSTEVDKLLEWLRSEPLPDVVNLPNALLIGLAEPVKRALGRPVCCTLQGEDLFLEGLPEPYRTRSLDLIRGQLEHVDAFLPVSDYYAAFMTRYLDIPEEKTHVVGIGINTADFPFRPRQPQPRFTVGYLARIAPEKGLDVLVGAYLHLRRTTDFDGTLEIAGYLPAEHLGYLNAQRRRLDGFDFRVHGELDREQKIRFLRSLDVLSVPCVYAEPKGLPLLEAMSSGVPVVEPRTGAFPEILRRTGGGLLTEPGPEAIARGIYELWRDPGRRRRLGEAGAVGVREHYTVEAMADAAMVIFTRLAEGAAVPQPARA